MTKQRKSRHRVPTLRMQSEPIDARYQIEVDMSTNRLERRYRRAQKALAAAEARAEHAHQALEAAATGIRRLRRQYDDLWLVVERRRAELREVELLMRPADCNGRDSRRRLVRHEAGAITIPLGATTGHRPKSPMQPTFPIRETKKTA